MRDTHTQAKLTKRHFPSYGAALILRGFTYEQPHSMRPCVKIDHLATGSPVACKRGKFRHGEAKVSYEPCMRAECFL